MAIDMGGPFNKAAYVFGTVAITTGNYDIMAAVMIGGMVPPLAIALAAAIFKNKFTAEERKNGTGQLYHGFKLYHRRSDSLCGGRSVTRHSGLLLGCCSFGRAFHALQMHAYGAARWYLRVCRSRQLASLFACFSGRHRAFRCFTRRIQKERFTKSLSFYSNKTRTENVS